MMVMDLFIEPSKGMPFCIEVGYFDTMKEIKEKVAKYHGIPVYEQTLIFKEKTLPDDLNIHTSDILDRSRIQLHITTTDQTKKLVVVKTEEESCDQKKSSMMMIKLVLKSSASLLGGAMTTTMEFDMNDSVLKLKEKMKVEMELGMIPFIIHANGIELHDDHKTLHECQLVDGSEVEIIIKQQQQQQAQPPNTSTIGNTSTSSSSSLSSSSSSMMNMMTSSSMGNTNNNNNKKLKVHVMSKCGKKMLLEVNPLNNVGELRKELHNKLVIRNNNNNNNNNNQLGSFRLPEDGYFFIYKQNVMDEDQSFRWHRVAQGDTIEIFNGCVTGGGS